MSFGELLHQAGVAAANADSARHRAICCRTVDAAARELPPDLPAAKASLAEALIGAVHALASAPSSAHRDQIAAALSALVRAGRMPLPAAVPIGKCEPRRLYWMED
jgi:hypothetical protein